MNGIIAIQQGDEATFKQVYEKYHEKLYFYILNKTSSGYIAEEVVQLAFIKLWNYRQSLSTEIPVEVQLFRIAKTSLIDQLRKNANQRRILNSISNLIPVEDNSALPGLLKKEMSERVAALIERLPPVRKKVFKLSREMGLSHKEIAEQLSLTPKNVENHIAKAIRQLKKNLPLTILSLIVAGIMLLRHF